jgi:hypothetical protein
MAVYTIISFNLTIPGVGGIAIMEIKTKKSKG